MVDFKPHTLVTFGGVLNATQAPAEIWQCGIRVMNAAATGPIGDSDAYLAGIVDPLSAWFSSAEAPMFPGLCQLSWVKANPIGSDGKYTDGTTHLHDYNPIVNGNGPTSGLYPDILAIAVSWGTSKAIRQHAYATHGRVYLPLFASAPLTPGSMRLAAGLNALVAAKGSALLHILAGGAVPAVPIVASSHNAEVNQITSVRCGDVYDVQRRRKDALKEVYSALPFTLG